MGQLKDLLVAGPSRLIGKLFVNEAQITTLDIPTTSGGTTYGPGTNGQYLRTNGTSVYWESIANTGSATQGVYFSNGKPVALSYVLQASVNSGVANSLTYYSGVNSIANADKNSGGLKFYTGNSSATTPVTYTQLHIYGPTVGNTAGNMISGTAGLFSFGDAGPQITFSTSSTSGSGQAGALIYTDHDTAATGVSWHFVSNQTDWNVTSKRFHARTSISVGQNLPNTSYNLYVNGTSYLNGDTTITGNILFQNTNQIIWNDGTYRQRIHLTDDSTADTAVFTFQQSANSGSSWSDLLIIKDNGTSIMTGGLEVRGHIAGDSGTAGHGLYSGGGYHNAYNNIILHGDNTSGSSGIAFVSDRVSNGVTITNINQPSDRAFIQYHAYGITTATAEGTAPTLATSGESGRLVIGIGNDATDQLWLQTPSRTGLIHQVATASYVIPDTGNTTGNVGSQMTPVYVSAGVITSLTGTLANDISGQAAKAVNDQNGYNINNNYHKEYIQTIDLTSKDTNTWYPVTISIPAAGLRRVACAVHLDSGYKPTWGSHNGGYTAIVEMLVVAGGWGTTAAQSICLQDNQQWLNSGEPKPVGYSQFTNSSRACFWCRGGAKYKLLTDFFNAWNIYDTNTTVSSQTIGPKTTYPGIEFTKSTIIANLDGNAASATKCGNSAIWWYPENNDELNIGGTNTSTTIYIGYRAKDSRAIPTKFIFGSSTGTANLQVKTVYLGSGTTSYISSSQYTGNAATATQIYSSASTTKAYVLGTTTASSANHATVYNANVYTQGSVLYGAAWNDYAEYRETAEEIEPGRVVIENGDDTLSLSTERMQAGAEISSDTFGFAIGETKQAKTPIATTGRVLAYPNEPRDTYKPGQPVCSGPNGTVSQMTDEEARNYPWLIIGTVSAIPDYKTWGEDNIEVKGRIWVRIR